MKSKANIAFLIAGVLFCCLGIYSLFAYPTYVTILCFLSGIVWIMASVNVKKANKTDNKK